MTLGLLLVTVCVLSFTAARYLWKLGRRRGERVWIALALAFFLQGAAYALRVLHFRSMWVLQLPALLTPLIALAAIACWRWSVCKVENVAAQNLMPPECNDSVLHGALDEFAAHPDRDKAVALVNS